MFVGLLHRLSWKTKLELLDKEKKDLEKLKLELETLKNEAEKSEQEARILYQQLQKG